MPKPGPKLPADLEIKSNIPVRYFNVVVRRGRLTERHHALLMQYIEGGYEQIGSSSGPLVDPKTLTVIPGFSQFVFYLDERVADAYLDEMQAEAGRE